MPCKRRRDGSYIARVSHGVPGCVSISLARSLAHRAAPARSALCLCPALGGAHPSLSDTPTTPGLPLWFRGEQPVSKGWVAYLRGPVLSCCRTPVHTPSLPVTYAVRILRLLIIDNDFRQRDINSESQGQHFKTQVKKRNYYSKRHKVNRFTRHQHHRR